MKPYILVVEDEEAISTLIKYNLEKDDFEVEVADDGEKAIESVLDKKPDLIILDWMLPVFSGIEICQKLRKSDDTRSIPIIMLTARGEEEDRLQGLDSGADDYIVKPFSPKELIARIKAVLRRTQPSLAGENIEFAGININVSGHKVSYADKPIHLGPTEFRLLVYLMENPNQVLSRNQMLDRVWGDDVYVESRTVDVHIRRLRKALDEAEDGLGGVIQTVRSAGYILEK